MADESKPDATQPTEPEQPADATQSVEAEQPADPEQDLDPQAKAADPDVKEKMREALERKHEHERQGEAHLQGRDKAHGLHGKAGGPRQFRRKAGS